MLSMNLSSSRAPSAAAGELAATLRELRELTPERLKEIESVVASYHAVKDAADSAQKAAAERIAAADVREQEARTLDARVRAECDERTRIATDRENRLSARERAADERERALTARETAVADAERRLARIKAQLEGV